MIALETVTKWLDEELEIMNFSRIDSSVNGLQVARTGGSIRKAAFAVDACFESFERAVKLGADVLIVHHGLLWGHAQSVTGYHYRRLKYLLDNDVALYAAHLPLDAHPEIGNNSVLAESLGLESIQPFGYYKGVPIGVQGNFRKSMSMNEVTKIIGGNDLKTVKTFPFGNEMVTNCSIVSGRMPSAIDEAIEKGLDLYISGEPAHDIYHRALESSINAIFGGHYNTETVGVMRLMEKTGQQFDIETTFIDVPTGL